MDSYELRIVYPPQTRSQINKMHDEWGGVITRWPAGERPHVEFAKRTRTRKQGRILLSTAKPGQLLCYSGCTVDGKSFSQFGLAWRSADGTLVAQRLDRDTKARGIFEAGGYREPSGDEARTLREIEAAVSSASPISIVLVCTAVARYMEQHLLVGAPVRQPGEADDEFVVRSAEALIRQGMQWQAYRHVLTAAADALSECLRLP
ncbi:hypothetical protein [Roseateles sp.]|uniref:hypothetical protein n=1 Tax=Roseateles sp. TaxID=1971397 RepID=UPI003BA4E34E